MATNSDWGYQTTTVENPIGITDSAWRYETVTLRNPHYPVGVLVNGTVRYVPILTNVGGELR